MTSKELNPAQEPLNFSELLTRCMGEREFACGILESFLKTCDRQLEDITELAERGCRDELAKLAHRFKGTAATVAAGPLSQLLAQIEQNARAWVKAQPADSAESTAALDREIDENIDLARHEIIRLRQFLISELAQ